MWYIYSLYICTIINNQKQTIMKAQFETQTDFNNLDELNDYLNENYSTYTGKFFNGGKFENYNELETSAETFFKEIGMDGEVYIRQVDDIRAYINDEDGYTTDLKVEFYECYVDSGVPAEDYYYGYIISGL